MKVFLSRRSLAPVALSLALLLLAVSPRGLFARPAQAPRWQSSKRPHPPRNVLPERAYEVARAFRTTNRTLEHAEAVLAPAVRPTLPARAAVDLAKPEYLRLYADPQHQTSPPA